MNGQDKTADLECVMTMRKASIQTQSHPIHLQATISNLTLIYVTDQGPWLCGACYSCNRTEQKICAGRRGLWEALHRPMASQSCNSNGVSVLQQQWQMALEGSMQGARSVRTSVHALLKQVEQHHLPS